MAGEDRHVRYRSLAHRYLPFLAIVALQLVILTQSPTTTTTTVAQPTGDEVAPAELSGEGSSAPAANAPADTGTTVAAGPSTGAAGAAAPRGGTAVQSSGTAARTAAAATGAQPAARTAAAGTGASGAVDALGRPTTGDKSKCAPGGVLQENVTLAPPPCIPKFVGDNGGATHQGVTGDTITVVILFPQYADGVNQALTAAGLQMTPEQAQESNDVWAAFFNKHYEFYGRKLKLVTHYYNCTDAACLRSEAKSIVAKHKPFIVDYYAYGIMPEPMIDQFTQLGVVSFQAPPLSDAWYKRQAPYAWSLEPNGSTASDMIADYYCKKLWGKNATLAGDPTMRVKKRKFGIVTPDDPASVEVANRLKQQVTGGMCGNDADGVTLYTISADATTAQNQLPTLVTRMKNDGITTRTIIAPSVGSQEDDKQQYYPENFFSGVGNGDDDLVGQFFSKLNSPTQAENTFGIGFYPKSSPPQEKEYYRAAKDVNPRYEPPYLSQGGFGGGLMAARLIQWAGPKLTPQTLEQGARTAPQLAGWTNPKAWPGWKCCNPYAQEWNFAKPNTFTAWADAREIYWSGSQISPSNGQPGTWVCVNDCRRYEVGQWPKGEPKQAS